MSKPKSNDPRPAKKWASDLDMAEYFSVSRCTIWRWVKIGKLPAPVKLGENTTRWDIDLAEKHLLGTAQSGSGEAAE